MTSVDLQEVTARQARLAAARALLHAHFVGIDEVIDELCDAVTVWYLMPQVLVRPVVVNLWGMTGVGKTDLVRRLVRALDLQSRFVQIEMSNTDTDSDYHLVADKLADSGLLDGEPAVLLFDEIQRFRTVANDGWPVRHTRFPDFWELLGDGQLVRRSKLAEDENRESNRETTTSDTIDCSRHLVIVSGNLDEAFAAAEDTAEVDVDADIFAAQTARVEVVDIKNALRRRFTPEQIARFGNVHIVYRSLGRAHFEEVIAREITRLADAAYRSFGVQVGVGPEVHELVYRNGVFPTQGVRPVLSSVGDIVGTHLAPLLFAALLDGAGEVTLGHDAKSAELVGTIGPVHGTGAREVRTRFDGRVDRIRGTAGPDQIACVAVHEAGHAIAYAALFGLAPLQLTARATGTDADGFHYRHRVVQTRDSELDLVVLALAGGQAEELVFGAGNASAGRQADRTHATELVLDHVRRNGFAKWGLDYGLDDEYATDASVAEPAAEKVLRRRLVRCDELLRTHRDALLALARALAAEGSLSSEQVSMLLAQYVLAAQVRPEDHEWTPAYAALLASPRL